MKSNKSKYKGSMDDSSETSSSNNDSYPRIDTHIEKTKVYSPLPQYLKLNLEMYDLYHEFKPHILTLDQLQQYGFPRESHDRPGHIVIDQNLKRGSTERICCRCHKGFYILPDGEYKSDSSCRYHPKKPLRYQKDHAYSGEFPCCNGNFMSEGCVTWQYHVSAESFLHDVVFVKSRSKRHLNEVTACTMYSLDCEMLYTTAGMEVAKVGIVGVDGLTVFESYVLPQNQILDYNTVYSGVTEKDLMNVTTTLLDVQTYILKLLNKDSILIGHGLENDLKALRLIHETVVDTSIVFPFQHSKFHRKSLKVVAKELLNKNIQQSANGHDSIEDARTCMEIMLHKINSDLQTRPPVIMDENQNILPPMHEYKELCPLITQHTFINPAHIYKAPTMPPWSHRDKRYYFDHSFVNYYPGEYIPKKFYQECFIY